MYRFPHEAGWYVLRSILPGHTDQDPTPKIPHTHQSSTVLLPTRTRLLLADGHSCYRPRRTGERKRKSIRGGMYAL